MSKVMENQIITKEVLEEAMSYETYFDLIKNLVAEGKTSGDDQSEKLVNFTRLNFQRMKRVYKTTVLNEDLLLEIEKLDRSMILLVLTEGWCGDAAQSLPVFSRISELSDRIGLKVLLRDENPDIINAYLTNGGKAIPKLIAVDAETLDELFVWGPRPVKFHAMVMEHRKNPKLSNEEFQESLHKAYTLDKTQAIQHEIKKLIANI